jgi:predicted secreted protein
MENQAVKDARSKKIIFLSHCCLNQNARIRGLAFSPGVVRPLIEYLLTQDVGIYQMTCPEVTFMGTLRWGQVKRQFDTPYFRAHCQKLSDQILDQVEDYRKGGYSILGFVMLDGSPVCGLDTIPVSLNENEDLGGMVWYMPQQKLTAGQGVFAEILKNSAIQRGFNDLPFISYPEKDDPVLLEEAFSRIKALFN